MKIIVAGTDSLGFVLAERTELFDRTFRVNTTHIPYAEHSKVLDVNDIDDYIKMFLNWKHYSKVFIYLKKCNLSTKL